MDVGTNGTYRSPVYTPTVAGVYRWIATYSGDATNLGLRLGLPPTRAGPRHASTRLRRRPRRRRRRRAAASAPAGWRWTGPVEPVARVARAARAELARSPAGLPAPP